MQYKYAKEQQDYSDLASGRVFYSLPEHPAFPVRLASEIFQRCIAFRREIYNISTPTTVYDPCCGAAYHLSVLGYLHRESIQQIIASDINEKAVDLAAKNLGLLATKGIDQRIMEISNMLGQYGKDSHKDALKSAEILRKKISSFEQGHILQIKTFQANATDENEILKNIKAKSVDIVFTDIPYGEHSHWEDSKDLSNPLHSMLDSLFGTLSPSSVLAIASDKRQKITHERYQRLEQFQIGKRRVVILTATPENTSQVK
jgi:23S rRNA (guanine2535-N1)-methyltransferase